MALIVFLIVFGNMAGFSRQAVAQNGTLNLAGPVIAPETLDPAQLRDLSGVLLMRQIFRGLMLFDDELNPIPEIAESYTVSEDGLIYDFVLRPNATFQDGTPITADDVAFSLNRAVDPDTVEGDASLLGGPAFLSDIEGFSDVFNNEVDEMSGINIVSDQELTVTLTHPQSTFLMKLATVPASIVSRSQVTSDSTWWAAPNGSGPFRVDDWQPEESLTLTAYDGFYLGAPSLDEINFRLGASALQSFNLYQSGAIDIDSVSLGDIDRVADPDGEFFSQMTTTPQFKLGYIALNPNVEPLDDPYVRAALQLIFPREDFANIAFDGWVNVANGMIPTQMLNRDWVDQLPPWSVEAAKAALAKSRYGSAENVPPIRIYAAGAFAAVALQDLARDELGLDIEVFDLQWEDMLDRLNSGDIPAYELYWATDYPDPAGILSSLFGTDEPDNYIGYSNPDVDQLLADAAAEPDVDARAEIYEQINAIICADNVVIPTYFDVEYTVVQPYVKNLVVTPMGIIRLETVQITD